MSDPPIFLPPLKFDPFNVEDMLEEVSKRSLQTSSSSLQSRARQSSEHAGLSNIPSPQNPAANTTSSFGEAPASTAAPLRRNSSITLVGSVPQHSEHGEQPNISPRQSIDNVSINSNTSETTLVDAQSLLSGLKHYVNIKQNLPHWVRRARYRQEVKKTEKQVEHIDQTFNGGELSELLADFFVDSKEEDVQELANKLTSLLSTNEIKPDWFLPGTILTAKVLSQVCEGDAQQAWKVLQSMGKKLDISGKERVSEIKEIEEKAWQCMQRLASVQGYALTAVLKLQGIEPNPAQPDQLSEEVALTRYLQAWHKLRGFYPELKAAPSITVEQIRSDKNPLNPEAEPALLVIEAAHEVMKHKSSIEQNVNSTTEDAPLTPKQKAAHWLWGHEIYDTSTRDAFMHRMLKLPTTILDYEKKREKFSRFERFQDNFLRAFGSRKTPRLRDNKLLTRIRDQNDSNEYDEAVNNATKNLCIGLRMQMHALLENDPSQKKQIAKIALEIVTLEMSQIMKGKNSDKNIFLDKQVVKQRLKQRLQQRRKEFEASKIFDKETSKIFDKKSSQIVRVLTEASLIWRVFSTSTNQIPWLANFISKKLNKELLAIEKLLTLTGIQDRAKDLPDDIFPDDIRESFNKSINDARDLTYDIQKPLNSRPALKELFERVITGPAGSGYSSSGGNETGGSLGAFHEMLSYVPVALLPDGGYTFNGRAFFEVKHDPIYGAQMVFGKLREHAGRVGLGVSVGYKSLFGPTKTFLGVSVTPSLRPKLPKIEEAGLRVGHDNDPALNKEINELFFTALGKAIEECERKQESSEHLLIQCFAEKLAGAFFDKKVSLFFNQHKKYLGEIGVVTRAGLMVGDDLTSIGGRIGGGFNLKKAIGISETISSSKRKIAQGSLKETKVDGVFGVTAVTPEIRSPFNKALGRTVYKEEQESHQISLQFNPNNRFAPDIVFENKTTKLDHKTPGSQLVSFKQYQMSPKHARHYNTLRQLEELSALDKEEKRRQQTSTHNTLINDSQMTVFSHASKNLWYEENVWQLANQRTERCINENDASGVRVILKARKMEQEQLTQPLKTTRQSHRSSRRNR